MSAQNAVVQPFATFLGSNASFLLPKSTSLMLVIGLTGGIATGKSTVSSLLQTKHHIPLIDADILARQVVEPGTPALKRIVSVFGQDILFPDGTLDRKKLGSIIFNDETKRKQLNGIVHPAVRWAMFKEVVKYWLSGEKMCVLDIPLLVESRLWRWVWGVVLVYCPKSTQLQRLMARDNSSSEEASSRLNSQLDIDVKLGYADEVVDNSGSREELETKVDALVLKLHRQAGLTWKLGWLFPPWGIFSAACILAYRNLWRRIPSDRKKV
ncbi:dephospho- kinase [Moniliophthora roreri MCA 2997]|uniref:Dephospho-kinase n=2 Tax=Moniliophthora roreri TaxID=221103 RepID=V2XG38_MONRO|nr:dephospho- kinase [Moniliophthora roreri MCA 2997]KAI3604062.1 dephospho-kinase [Moniliophthora roreri]